VDKNSPFILSSQHRTLMFGTWIVVLAFVIFDEFWMLAAGVRLTASMLFITAFAVLSLCAVSAFYRYYRRDDGLWLATQLTAQLILGSVALGIMNYMGARLAFPFIDAQLVHLDQSIGFNWQAYIGWVNRHPLVAHIFTFSYRSTGPEIIVVLALLCLFRKATALHLFALQMLISAFITITMATFWPVLPSFAYHGIDAAAYPNLQIATATGFVSDIMGMRDHTTTLLPAALQGIVGFPSFHSTLAVLVMAAVRATPVTALRLPVYLFNVIMLLSTPVDGGHYLVDTLAGIALGVITIIGVNRFAKLAG
jgi:membrane-associated phospholipid phosphatase